MPEKAKNQRGTAKAKRLADALRENLHRRKLQVRSRKAASGTVADNQPDEQSGPEPDKR